MKIAVFTNCQPRHIALIEQLSSLADRLYACVEVSTLHPGRHADFYRKSDVMAEYFRLVEEAQSREFGEPRYLPAGIRALIMKSGDLSDLPISTFHEALDADILVVFGASYIKGPLAQALIDRKAINIHMGTSPFYRGSSCNFWALQDGNIGYVGATLHYLSEGLDSGPIISHALPDIRPGEKIDGFGLGMRAVRSAFDRLAILFESNLWEQIPTIKQERKLELRYSTNAEFNDAVARKYLSNQPSHDDIIRSIQKRDDVFYVVGDRVLPSSD